MSLCAENGQSPLQLLRSEESVTLNLTLHNLGASASFTVDITTSPASSGFTYALGSSSDRIQSVPLDSGFMTTLKLKVTADRGISEANFLSLLVSMYDANESRRSNYLTINIEGSSFNGASSLHSASIVWVLMVCTLLVSVIGHWLYYPNVWTVRRKKYTV